MIKRRIGLFGGAFDPPHRAHVALVHAALNQFSLDELRVLPTGQAWHKSRELTCAEHRLAMTQLAFAEFERVVVDAREMQRAGATYTIDTLEALQREQANCEWWLFIGQDQAERFQTWHRWPDILSAAQVVVARRPESTPLEPEGKHEPKEGQWHNRTNAQALQPMQQLQWSPLVISATAIRLAVARGQDTAAWLQPQVQHYIQQHHLYRDNHE